MGCSGKRGGNSFHPDASINASSFGPPGRYKVFVIGFQNYGNSVD